MMRETECLGCCWVRGGAWRQAAVRGARPRHASGTPRPRSGCASDAPPAARARGPTAFSVDTHVSAHTARTGVVLVVAAGQTWEGLRDGSVSAGKKSATSWSRRTRFLHEGHVGRFSSHFSRQLSSSANVRNAKPHRQRDEREGGNGADLRPKMCPQRVAHMQCGGASCTGSRQMLHTMHAGVAASAPVLLLSLLLLVLSEAAISRLWANRSFPLCTFSGTRCK